MVRGHPHRGAGPGVAVTHASYWVELFQSQQRLGGGFLLTRRYVLTALHCLRGLTSPDEHVDVVLTDGS
ncbi:hypothetical protein DVA86_05805 [Streptomyces armeniacus]|uniref:Peptidase S1 domain-containing protein n=1 Tax=Streptomyces armeniacus TaxID=83291 RepID=A0A345XZP3_9ACTN|nr:hypothetical protein DVA86_05805 [Streptomyces armeniacus]